MYTLRVIANELLKERKAKKSQHQRQQKPRNEEKSTSGTERESERESKKQHHDRKRERVKFSFGHSFFFLSMLLVAYRALCMHCMANVNRKMRKKGETSINYAVSVKIVDTFYAYRERISLAVYVRRKKKCSVEKRLQQKEK